MFLTSLLPRRILFEWVSFEPTYTKLFQACFFKANHLERNSN